MSALRKKAEVARYLQKDPPEVDRLVEQDGLPMLRLPGEKRPTPRFRLRDLHAWLQAYRQGAAPMSYEEFVEEFEAAQGRKCGVMSEL